MEKVFTVRIIIESEPEKRFNLQQYDSVYKLRRHIREATSLYDFSMFYKDNNIDDKIGEFVKNILEIDDNKIYCKKSPTRSVFI